MTSSAALPEKASNKEGTILTFVVPSAHGCNLSCPFCIIEQRRESAKSKNLLSFSYCEFIKEIASREIITAICIQGHEPLLQESIEYTSAILATGKRLGVPTSLVTNGVLLSESVDELRDLEPTRIVVSLDAAASDQHDRQRGKAGAWEATVDGLKRAVTGLSPNTELVVASVLLPKRRKQLEGMPSLLKKIGIKQWIINLLQKVGKNDVGGPIGDQAKIFQDLVILKAAADAYDIEFVVDDEFDGLQSTDLPENVVDINALRINRLPRPSDLFRLLPTGQCTSGTDILKLVSDDAPLWVPGEEHAGDFIQRMRAG